MFCRSVGCILCTFVALVTASSYTNPDSASETSSVEPKQDVKVTPTLDLCALLGVPDGTLVTLVADGALPGDHNASVAARSPVVVASTRCGALAAGSGHVTAPGEKGPRQMLDHVYHLQGPQQPSMARKLQVAAGRHSEAGGATEPAADAAALAVWQAVASLRQAVSAFQGAALQGVVSNQRKPAVQVSRQPPEPSTETRWLAVPVTSSATPTTQPRTGRSHTRIATAPSATHHYQPTPASTLVSTQRVASTAVSGEDRPTTQGSTAASVAQSSAPRHTTLPDDATTSGLRDSAQERGMKLLQAAYENAVGELQLLLAEGVDVEARNDWGWTALHWAAQKGHVAAASCLLAAGAEAGARDRQCWTPLHAAASWGHTGVARLLLAHSADPNARDEDLWTPLHFAAYNGHAETAAALLEAGADKQATDSLGRTPIDHARTWNYNKVVDILS